MTPIRPTVVLVAALTLTLAIAACGGGPAPSQLTDPTAILAAAAEQATKAQGVRVDVTADGELNLDLMGTGSGAPLQLTDSTAGADLDLRTGDARATFSLPGILGLRGELLAVDGVGYLKSSLTGQGYRSMSFGPSGGPAPSGSATGPSASPGTASMLAALTAFLARPELAPVKGEDVACGSATCYTVTMSLTPEELAALAQEAGGPGSPLPSALPIPLPSLGAVSVDLTAHIAQDTLRLAGMTAVIDSGGAKPATVDVTFSKWDEPVSVSAPPADQVSPGG